ncbi:MAG: thioesterase family protein [Chitinophagaceae bacterium]
MPDTYAFNTTIPVRITDLNYGGHIGNDSLLSIIHEARMQFLQKFQASELHFFDHSLIMSDVAIEFKSEGFYGDRLLVGVAATHFSRVGFDLYYSLTKVEEKGSVTIALAKTGMIYFDYNSKKVMPIPLGISQLLSQ